MVFMLAGFLPIIEPIILSINVLGASHLETEGVTQFVPRAFKIPQSPAWRPYPSRAQSTFDGQVISDMQGH